MFGVSPKFFIVRCGENLTVDGYIRSLDRLKALGFMNFQGEIYKEELLSDWKENALRLEKRRVELGLNMDMFVAHFLVEGSLNLINLKDRRFDDLFIDVLNILSSFPSLKTVCVPIGKYADKSTDEAKYLLSMRLKSYSEKAEERGLNFAVEVLSGALLNYYDLASMRENYSLRNFGLNLDTGHANLIMHEKICEIPSLIPIYGTHIKDNDGKRADELKPGDGTIDWNGLIGAMESSGYSESYDFELSSEDDEEYIKAEKYISKYIKVN